MPAYKMPSTPVLKTPRLVLRPVRSKDVPVIQRRFPRWEIVQWLDAKVPWPYPPDGAATFVAACIEEIARGEKSHWAIVPKSGPADLIGFINLWPDDGVSRNQRGFWLDLDFQGHGLMTEAADCVTDYAFRELGWPHLWLSNAHSNHASRRIKEKQGARLVEMMMGRYVGGEASQMVWQLAREEWLARRLQSDAISSAAAEDRSQARRLVSRRL